MSFLEFFEFNLGINPKNIIMVKLDMMIIDDLKTVIYDTTNFNWLPEHDSIITFETRAGKIILMDAPNLK